MRRFLTIGLVAACLLAGTRAGGQAAVEAQKDRLRILRNGQPVGSEQYEIAGTGTEVHARADVTLSLGEAQVHQKASLLLRADLAPRRYEWRMEEPLKRWLRVEFSGNRGTIYFPREDGQEEQQVFDFGTTRVAVLDNNIFHHFLLLARLYDFDRGGPQTIKVFIPQSVQPGEVTVELLGVETREVEGRPQPVRQLALTTADNRVLLWVSARGRFVRLQVPQANVEVVPEGAVP